MSAPIGARKEVSWAGVQLVPEGTERPGEGVCARMAPESKVVGWRVWIVTPVRREEVRRVWWIGAGPWKLVFVF
jgi:hypothetical protein